MIFFSAIDNGQDTLRRRARVMHHYFQWTLDEQHDKTTSFSERTMDPWRDYTLETRAGSHMTVGVDAVRFTLSFICGLCVMWKT